MEITSRLRRRLLNGAALGVTGLFGGLRTAQAEKPYPTNTIRFICPFAAVGSADMVSRIIAEQLTKRMGQAVVVENRTGAGGNIGTRLVAASPPDGYTLLLGYDGSLVVNPHIYKHIPFDSVKDFKPVGLIGDVPLLVLVNPKVQAKNLMELIALSKSTPHGLAYGSPGVGSTQHLMFELIKERSGANFVHVPYRGAAPAMVDAMGGAIPLVGAALAGSVQYIKAGKLRPLAVSSSYRSTHLPDVPTLSESGLKGMSITTWHGLLVPVATPEAIVLKLNKELNAALRDPQVIARLDSVGSVPTPTTPEGFGERIKHDLVSYGELVKAANIQPVD
jgi:tripartite-type tricarboxylate transporter receptor subunit TctC